jgi:hypothetical protein
MKTIPANLELVALNVPFFILVLLLFGATRLRVWLRYGTTSRNGRGFDSWLDHVIFLTRPAALLLLVLNRALTEIATRAIEGGWRPKTPNSLILFTLILEVLLSSETSVLARATRRHI